MTKAAESSEISVHVYQTTRPHIPQKTENMLNKFSEKIRRDYDNTCKTSDERVLE
jgi:hypothetical protein